MPDNKHDDSPGGVSWVTKNAKFIGDTFNQELDGLNAHKRGMDVGRELQPENTAPVTDEPERAILSIAEANSARLSGVAQKASLYALEAIQGRPTDLNPEALVAKARRDTKTLDVATAEKIKPTVHDETDAQAELNYFTTEHKRGTLGANDYSETATTFKVLLILLVVVLLDTFLHAMQFVPVMAQGLFQALTISGVTSVSMALFGALTGTAFRFWNYATRSTRYWWRLCGVLSILISGVIALIMAQYRAVLEVVAREGGEPSLSAILATPPTIMSSTVFVAAAIVFLFSLMKFRGGQGTPWATYGDHAKFDRGLRQQKAKLLHQKGRYVDALRQIIANTIADFEDFHEVDRKQLQKAIDVRNRAVLNIKDLQKSDHQYFKHALREVQRFRDGVLSVRPDIAPGQFKPLPEFQAQDFPDTADLDRGLEDAKATFESRTRQLAALQKEVGQLEEDAISRFGEMIEEINRQVPHNRKKNREVSRLGTLAGEPA